MKPVNQSHVVGVIAEYNPFHNGHLFQLNEAKRLSGAEYVIVIMSGSYVQRGTPAFLDKMTRTKMALENGADLVIELPVRYATGSAEFFASGAVSILHNLGIVDSLCFGSEHGDTIAMKNIADFIQKDCDDFNKAVAEHVKKGCSYPSSREKALLEHCKTVEPSILKEIISSPNNILGIEYLKALQQYSKSITPLTVKRAQTGYHDLNLEPSADNDYSIHSATAIRSNIIKNANLDKIQHSVPDSVLKLMKNHTAYPVTSDMLSDILYYKLATSSILELTSYMDVTADLARTIKNSLSLYESFEQFVFVLKSKQYTYTRISRCLIHIILNIKEYNLQNMSSKDIAPYARILGFRKNSSVLLKEIKKNASLTLITKMADAKDMLSEDALCMLSEDIFATDLYKRLVYQSFHIKEKNDIQTSPVIL